jgi:hypothetical protein
MSVDNGLKLNALGFIVAPEGLRLIVQEHLPDIVT